MATSILDDSAIGLERGSVASGTDLNNVTTMGVYILSSSSTYTNAPATYGILEVVVPYIDSTNYMIQRLTTTSAIYIRYRSSGSWLAWKTLTAS